MLSKHEEERDLERQIEVEGSDVPSEQVELLATSLGHEERRDVAANRTTSSSRKSPRRVASCRQVRVARSTWSAG